MSLINEALKQAKSHTARGGGRPPPGSPEDPTPATPADPGQTCSRSVSCSWA